MATWIFQGNPKLFDVDTYLATRKDITWLVNQEHYKDQISVGDEVFLWRSDGGKKESGGVVARGRITSAPNYIKDDAPALWREPIASSPALRVCIRLEDVRLTPEQGMLLRVNLENDRAMMDMRIVRFRSETNYVLERRHADRLRKLWSTRKP